MRLRIFCSLILILTGHKDNNISGRCFDPLSDDKILNWSNLKDFADDKINVTNFVLERVENIVGKVLFVRVV